MATQGAYPPPGYSEKGGEQQPFQPQYPPQQGQYPLQQEQYPLQPGQYPPQQQQYPPQQGYTPGYGQVTSVVTATPGVAPTMMMVSHVNDYMGFSIFTFLCCCFPLGIAAIVFSCEAQDANARGDVVRAQAASGRAKTLNWIALGLGIAAWVFGIIFLIVWFTVFIPSWWG